MIIWLASYPRSGNTFFTVVLTRAFGIYPTYSVYDESYYVRRPDHKKVPNNLQALMQDAAVDSMDGVAKLDRPFFLKTHDLPSSDNWPAIYIVRDGRDVLVSYAHYIIDFERSEPAPRARRETTSQDSELEQIMRDLLIHEASFGGWGRNVKAWINRDPGATLVKFEDLTCKPVEVVRATLSQIGHPIELKQGEDSFPTFDVIRQDASMRNRGQFFRRGKIGAFRDEMPADLEELFWTKYGAIMEELKYDR